MARDEERQELLISLELMALSTLLKHWATPCVVHRRGKEWKRRLPACRKAVLAAEHCKKPEKVAHEILADEYEVMHEAAADLCEKCSGMDVADAVGYLREATILNTVAGRGLSKRTVDRPLMVPSSRVEGIAKELATSSSYASVVGSEIAAARFGTSAKTVKNAQRRVSRLEERSDFQRLAASVFLDLMLCEGNTKRAEYAARILDSLLFSGYSSLALYYLVQAASQLPRVSKALCPDVNVVNQVCGMLESKRDGDATSPFKRALLL